ncbi:arylamine N-acetyltransferase, pineal gland isozyme NAT-3-like [Antedon mediterranea]|uniref:arylamine N-acetyltransferase, pineal gland isozyme NAT-3-like n=1 Tax=Antedon mediterranea TaxID=105859 RepID=UPI003AF4B5BC
MLTKDDAIDFVRSVLKIEDVEEKFKKDQYALLCSITKKYVHTEPFQNLTLLATKHEERHCPTLDEIQKDIYSTVGGLCFHHNVFMKYLLESLGYQVHFIACDIRFPGNHVAVLVKELIKPGDSYYVDVGCGYLIEQPISMQFDEKSQIYHQGFIRYQFVRKNGVIQRIQTIAKFRPVLQKEITKERNWFVFLEMTLEPRELDYFSEAMRKVYTVRNAHSGWFLNDIRMVHKAQGKLVALKNTTFFSENENNELVDTTLLSKNDLIKWVEKYTPQIAVSNINPAVTNIQLQFECGE